MIETDLDKIKQALHFPETFDNFTLSTYQTCPRKFQLRILQGVVPNSHARSLSFGQAMHDFLEKWYLTVRTPRDAIRELLKPIDKQLEELGYTVADTLAVPDDSIRLEYAIRSSFLKLPPLDPNIPDHRTHGLLDALARGYVLKYKYEPWDVVYVEKNFVFILPGDYPYSGIMDLVIRTNDGRVKPMEHKTTSSLWNFDQQFDPNQQVAGYIHGLQSFMSDASDEAIINAILVSKRKNVTVSEQDYARFVNIVRSPAHLEEFKTDAVDTIHKMEEDYKKGYFRKNTVSCHQYGGCPYRTICKAEPGFDRQLKFQSFYTIEEWNPLKRDEKPTAE